MAKGKTGGGVQNRAIYSRISFLQQAAVTLSSIRHTSPGSSGTVGIATAPSTSVELESGSSGDVPVAAPLQGMSRRLATDLRSVSLKTRIRLNPAVKQTICKFCDSPLIEGNSCTSSIENKSKGAKKFWADVLVRKCHTCGRERRYPVSAARPKRKIDRGVSETGGLSQQQKQEG